MAYGEGRTDCSDPHALQAVQPQITLRYVEHTEDTATRYPANPNGSPEGRWWVKFVAYTNIKKLIRISSCHSARSRGIYLTFWMLRLRAA